VSDDVIAVTQEVRDEVGVPLEVDPPDRRSGRKPRALDDEKLEALGERLLCAPGRTPAEDAPVDEDDALHGAILRPVCTATGSGLVSRH
jgi:hypothetical protein